MRTKTINLALPEDLLDEVDKVAKEEYRSRSELMREALRRYVIIPQWDKLERSIRAEAKKRGYAPADVDQWIAEDRAQK